VAAVGVEVRSALDGLDGGRAHRLIHADLHRDNLLIDRGEVGVIDFDDCGWGYFAYDLATLLDSFARHIASDPDNQCALRDAYLRGYECVRALPAEFERHSGTFAVMRDMVNVDFILRSNNPNVAMWGPPRLGYLFAQLEAYLEGSPRHESRI
jgi:Ser/Thr protein kinase RdoA (MazF antagonist)